MSILNQQSVSLLRWGAIAGGVYYGFSRHSSLTSFVQERSKQEAAAHHNELINEAKIAYEAQYNREQDKLAEKAGVATTDSNSYRFSAEKYIAWGLSTMEGESAK